MLALEEEPETEHETSEAAGGAALGATLVNVAKSYFTVSLPEMWLFALGGLFVAVTLFLPRGLVGLATSIARRLRGPRRARGDPGASAHTDGALDHGA